MFRDQLNEDRIRAINRMHREMKIYFPEYKDALGKVDGAFSLELLKSAPFPADLKALDENGIRQIWHEAKLRGRGYSRSGEILGYAFTVLNNFINGISFIHFYSFESGCRNILFAFCTHPMRRVRLVHIMPMPIFPELQLTCL